MVCLGGNEKRGSTLSRQIERDMLRNMFHIGKRDFRDFPSVVVNGEILLLLVGIGITQ